MVTYSTCIFQYQAAKFMTVPLQPTLNIRRRVLIALLLLLLAGVSQAQKNATDSGDGKSQQPCP